MHVAIMFVYMSCIYICGKFYQPYKQTAIERKVLMVVKILMNCLKFIKFSSVKLSCHMVCMHLCYDHK